MSKWRFLTVDIDTLQKRAARRAIYGMQELGCINLRVYRTKKGYHVTAFVWGLSREAMFAVRELLGDDHLRIEIDRNLRPKRPEGILWTKKNGRKEKRVSISTLGVSLRPTIRKSTA